MPSGKNDGLKGKGALWCGQAAKMVMQMSGRGSAKLVQPRGPRFIAVRIAPQ
jgi:hypothetical protein